MPGGAPYHPAGFMTFVGASAMVNGQTMGVYPAAKALLSAVYEGALVPFDTALKIEARHFTSVIMNPSSSNMIRSLFLNKGASGQRRGTAQRGARSIRTQVGHSWRGNDGRGHCTCLGTGWY